MTNKNHVLHHYSNFIIRKIKDPHFGVCFRVTKPEWAQNVYFSEGKTEAKAWKAAKERTDKIIDESVKMATIIELSSDVEQRDKAARRLLSLNPTARQLLTIEENCTFDGIIDAVRKIIRLNVDISKQLIEWCQKFEKKNNGTITLQRLKTFDII
jgi:hypothetical protein